MNELLRATFQYLAKTDNEAAVDVLRAALDCPNPESRHEALLALLQRRSSAGRQEVFRRLAGLDEDSRAFLREHRGRLIPVVAEGLRGSAAGTVGVACAAAISFCLYEAMPQLVAALVTPDYEHAALVAGTLRRLTELFYAELTSGESSQHRDPDGMRLRITAALEEAVRKFHRHRREEVVEALLLVVKQSNVTLRQLLSRPDEACYETLRKTLAESPRGGVMRLLLGFLEDPQSPRAVLEVIARRCDSKFLEHLLLRVGARPSKTIAERLARIDDIAWAQPGHPAIAQLSEEAQKGAVQMMMASGMARSKVLAALGPILLEGKTAARRAAAEALAQFDEPEASALLVKALNDEDPEVRAHLIVQLRPRNIPGALLLLIRMADNSNPEIRGALRTALPEFTLRQFLLNFDALDDDTRVTAGVLVKTIDDDAVAGLAKELESLSPVRRRRAVLAAEATGLVHELEEKIVKLLSDDDHMVRVAVARALANCNSRPTWEALREALLDRSFVVREAAEGSLLGISRSLSSSQRSEEEPQEVVS
jgi:HEAT repeat protein